MQSVTLSPSQFTRRAQLAYSRLLDKPSINVLIGNYPFRRLGKRDILGRSANVGKQRISNNHDHT